MYGSLPSPFYGIVQVLVKLTLFCFILVNRAAWDLACTFLACLKRVTGPRLLVLCRPNNPHFLALSFFSSPSLKESRLDTVVTTGEEWARRKQEIWDLMWVELLISCIHRSVPTLIWPDSIVPVYMHCRVFRHNEASWIHKEAICWKACALQGCGVEERTGWYDCHGFHVCVWIHPWICPPYGPFWCQLTLQYFCGHDDVLFEEHTNILIEYIKEQVNESTLSEELYHSGNKVTNNHVLISQSLTMISIRLYNCCCDFTTNYDDRLVLPM